MIDLKVYREIKVVEWAILVVLWLTACALTIIFKGFYNQDLGVSVFVVESLEGVGFIEAIQTNSTIFYLLRMIGDSFVFNHDYTLLMYWFYIIAQTYIIFSLARYAGLYYTILIVFVVFFTVILNQMRFGIAISMMLMALHNNEEGDKTVIQQITLGIVITLFHIFVGVFYFLYLITRKFNHLIYVFGFLAIVGFSSLSILFEDSRYLYYLEEDAARGSFSFLLFLVIYATAFFSLDRFHRLYFLFLLLIAAASYSLASISSRLSELSIIFLLVVLSKMEVPYWAKLLLLSFSISFFLYRAFNWFVMGQVPLAP